METGLDKKITLIWILWSRLPVGNALARWLCSRLGELVTLIETELDTSLQPHHRIVTIKHKPPPLTETLSILESELMHS